MLILERISRKESRHLFKKKEKFKLWGLSDHFTARIQGGGSLCSVGQVRIREPRMGDFPFKIKAKKGHLNPPNDIVILIYLKTVIH